MRIEFVKEHAVFSVLSERPAER